MPVIVFEPAALAELDAAALYLEEKSPGLGQRLSAAFHEAVQKICEFPHAWPQVEEGLRRCPVDGTSYWIVYAYSAEQLSIFAVSHSSRRPDYWRERWR